MLSSELGLILISIAINILDHFQIIASSPLVTVSNRTMRQECHQGSQDQPVLANGSLQKV